MKKLTTHQALYVFSIAFGSFGVGCLANIPPANAAIACIGGGACAVYLSMSHEPGESAPSSAQQSTPTLTQAEWERMVGSTPIRQLSIPSETEQRILDLVESANCTPEQLAEILSPFLPAQSPR